MKKSLLLLCFIVPLVGGCQYSWRVGQLPPISPWPPQPEHDQSISLTITARTKINNGRENETTPFKRDAWRDSIVSAYQESRLFSKVELSPFDSDLEAEIRIFDQIEAHNILDVLYLLTLDIIPTYGQSDTIITTTIKNRKGETLGVFEHSQRIKRIMTIFLLPVYPLFRTAFLREKEALNDMTRLTILEAHGKGIL